MFESLFAKSPYVCEIKYFLRARLILFMYSNFELSKCFRFFSKLYCFIGPSALVYGAILEIVQFNLNADSFYSLPRLIKLLLSAWYALYRGDYICNYFLRNNVTDVTLDAASIFMKLEKFIKYIFLVTNFLKIIEISLIQTIWGQVIEPMSYVRCGILELYFNNCIIEKTLILGLLNSRLLILRKKLQRYGFKNIRDVKFGQRVYSEMYLRIMQNQTIQTPLKMSVRTQKFILSLF